MERDFVGYGSTPPVVLWPNGARLAVQVSVADGAGGEYTMLAARRSSARDDGRSAVAGAARPPRPLQRVLLRVRQPGRSVANPGPLPRPRRARFVVGVRPGARAQSGGGPRPRRGRPRDLRPR